MRTSPVYCSITDGLIGSRTRSTGRVFQTAALAHKIAGQLEQADYDGCGDDSFRVWDITRRCYHYLPMRATDEECPF